MRRFTRILPHTGFLGSIILACMVGCGDDRSSPYEPQAIDQPLVDASVEIGPIDGLTTAWHPAPQQFSFPRGYTLRLRCPLTSGQSIAWNGALEVERLEGWSIAECATNSLGIFVVTATVNGQESGGGDKEKRPTLRSASSSCEVKVIDAHSRLMTVEDVELHREPIEIRENASNWETLRLYRAGPVSRLRQVGALYYRTAVGTPVRLVCRTDPAEFSPLTEWRFDGKPVLMTSDGGYVLSQDIGTHEIAVGPPANERRLRIDLYRTKIVDGLDEFARVASNDVVTFRAATEPAGFEHDVTWLVSTLYGSAKPIIGRGATFVVRFEDVVGFANGSLSQWIGVRADNASATSEQAPTPFITSFTPSTIVDESAVTINGDNFPLDPTAISLEFSLPNGSYTSVLGISVLDLDSDGLGERIVGTAGPVPPAVVGQSLPLTLQLCHGFLDQGFKLSHYTQGEDLAVQSIQLATFAQQGGGKVVGSFNNAADTLTFDLTTIDTWMANKTYGVAGTIKITYTLNGKTKTCKLEIKDSALFTADGDPTAAECAQETATIYQAKLDLADTQPELECKNNFEVKTEGNKIIVVKKSGSGANMIAPTEGTLKFKCE